MDWIEKSYFLLLALHIYAIIPCIMEEWQPIIFVLFIQILSNQGPEITEYLFSCYGCWQYNCWVEQNVIRNDVFTPDYLSQAEFEQQWDQNASFLKPMTQSYNSEMVRNWSPSQVAKFILSLPKFQQSDMTKLEMKVIEEELDGEAFLLMTQNDFVKMLGLKLGPAIKIYNALLLIKKASSWNVTISKVRYNMCSNKVLCLTALSI